MATNLINAKRAGIYLNGEMYGYCTDITIRLAQEINDHPIIGSDRKIFADGAQIATFSLGGLHFTDSKIAFLSSDYPAINTTTGRVEPQALNAVQSKTSIWQTTAGVGNPVNPVYDDTLNAAAAQSFVAGGPSLHDTAADWRCKVLLKEVGTFASSGQDMNWYVVADDTGAPEYGGDVYCSGTITQSDLDAVTSTPSWVSLKTVTNTNDMTPGEKYWLVLYYDDGDAEGDDANHIGWVHTDTSVYEPRLSTWSKTADQTVDKAYAVQAETDGAAPASWDAWTVDTTLYSDHAFILTFNTPSNWEIVARIIGADGETRSWSIVHECVFDIEDKDFPASDALYARYTGRGSYGEYKGTYP